MPSYFSRQAEAYARHRPRYPEALFAWIKQTKPDAALVWDCATGNGQAARGLADHYPRIIATDHSPAQLKLAERHPHIEYRETEATKSGLPDQSVDLVTVAQALHWFFGPEFWMEVKRVLKPGGIFLAWTYAQHQLDAPKLTALTNHYHDVVLKPYWPARRRHPVTRYREIEIPFEPIAMPEFSLEAEHNLESHTGYLRSWSGSQRYLDATGKDPLATIGADLKALWGDPEKKRRVIWPLTVKGGIFTS